MQKLLILLLAVVVELAFGHGHLVGNQKIHSATEVKHLVQLHKAWKEHVKLQSSKPKTRFWQANYVNDYLTLNITVGSPAKQFNVAIETATSRMWLLDSSLAGQTAAKNVYDPTKSKKSDKKPGDFEGASGPYIITGDLYKDSVNLNGEFDFDQDFGSIFSFGLGPINKYPLDGALGLQWNPDNTQWGEDSSPIINLLQPCDKRWITIWIGPHLAPSKGVSKYEITLGATDNNNCEKGLHFIPLTTFSGITSILAITVDSFSLGAFKSDPNELATTDTGFPVIQVSALEYMEIGEQTKAVYDFDLELLTVPCSSISTLSDLIFTIRGVDYAVPASNYIVDLDIGDGNCVLAVGMNQDTTDYPQIVLGNPFMRTYCTTYNVDAKSISFSKALLN